MLAQATSQSLMMVAVRQLSFNGIGGFEAAFFRGFIGVLIMMPWLMVTLRHRPSLLWPPEWRLVLIRMTMGAVGVMFWFIGLGGLTVANVAAIQFTHPLFVVIGAALILREGVGRARWTAVAIGLLGALVIVRPGIVPLSFAVFAVLISATLNAGVQLVTKRVSATVSGAVLVFYMNLMMAPLALIFALPDWVWPQASDIGWLIAIGTFGTIAHVFLARAMKLADASLVGPVDFMRLPIAALFGWMLFGELADFWVWAGASVIIGAVFYVTRRESQRGN
jgi:drug/metabolite transporter (DMT)-like permease